MLATGFAAWAAMPVIDIRGRVGWRGEVMCLHLAGVNLR